MKILRGPELYLMIWELFLNAGSHNDVNKIKTVSTAKVDLIRSNMSIICHLF